MMQQIAMNKSDIAASTSSLDIAVEPAAATEFSVVFQTQQRASVSAFERARDRAEHIQGNVVHNAKHSSNTQASKRSDEQNTVSDESDAFASRDANSSSSISSGHQEKKHVSQTHHDDNQHSSQDIDDVVEYVKYVDRLNASESNSSDGSQPLSDVLESKKWALDTEIDLTNTLDSIDEENIKFPGAGEEAVQEFIKVHLRVDDLKSILAAQQKQHSENSELFDSLKVEQAIKNILHAGKRDGENQNVFLDDSTSTLAQGLETVSDESVDINLMKALLIPSKGDLQSGEGDNSASNYLASPTDNGENDQSSATGIEALLSKSSAATINISTDVSLNGEAAGKLVELNVRKTGTELASNQSLSMLAQLDAEQQQKALDNVNTRLKTILSDLKTDGKATEFVAAMQAGLKEFKDQLKQGREPGIDLKTLVLDALQSANVEIPPSQSSKIDGNLQQFAGILNLANSVQMTQNHYATGEFSPSENILLEKSAQNTTEGMKLAQAQTNANSALDKAVNIFKPEGQQQLADKVRWMINGRNTAAEIRLDPPELGAMQIRINMSGEAAVVSFTVQSAQAKEALDQSALKLREILQETGIELGESSVEQDSSGFQQEQQTQDDELLASAKTSALNVEAINEKEKDARSVVEQRITGATIGGIDYFA